MNNVQILGFQINKLSQSKFDKFSRTNWEMGNYEGGLGLASKWGC